MQKGESGEATPVYKGVASHKMVQVLNEVFQSLGLSFKAIYEGKPDCYDTVRYGWVCDYDDLPVYILDGKGNKVRAELIELDGYFNEYSGFGAAEGYGKYTFSLLIYEEGENRLRVHRIIFEAELGMTDYAYGWHFKEVKKHDVVQDKILNIPVKVIS